MKNSTLKSLAILVGPLCMLIGCMGSNGGTIQVSPETAARPQNPDQIIMDYMEDREVYKVTVTDSLDQNNEKIIVLREKAFRMNNSERLALEKKLNRIERMNNYMRIQLNNYQGEGIESWDRFKEDFSRDLRDLNDAVDRVSQEKN